MMRILLDTDVVLDLFLDKEPFSADSAVLWAAHEKAHLVTYISAITPVNLFYIARKLKGRDIARQAVVELLAALPVCLVDQAVLRNGLDTGFNDYEDAVQYSSAITSGLDAILTRNPQDYKSAKLPVYTPSGFLKNFPVYQTNE